MNQYPTQAQLQARDELASLSLHAHDIAAVHKDHGAEHVLARALEATREFLPAELRSTIDTILDTCAMGVQHG